MKKVLILHTSVGLGHKSMAENLAYYYESFGNEVKLFDVTHAHNGPLDNIVVAFHSFVNRYLPFVWGFMYHYGHWLFYFFRLPLAKFHSEKVLHVIKEFNPDLVIATQTTASAMAAYLKKSGKYKNKFAIAFSDYHLHPFWLYKQADFYLANIQEQKEQMIKQGYKAEEIFVCGLSIKPKLELDKNAVKQKLNIEDNQKVILVGTGSLGIGFDLKDLVSLSKISGAKIIFVCGKNEQLHQKIKNMELPNVLPLGFYKPMDELYAIADGLVSKPGGLTTAEALSWRLPIFITFTLPGQEVLNYNYLIGKNLVIKKPVDLAVAVKHELETGEFRLQLERNSNITAILGDREVLRQAQELF